MTPVARDMEGGDWRGLIRGLLKFFAEESREAEHAPGAEVTDDGAARGSVVTAYPGLSTAPSSGIIPIAASTAIVAPSGRVLFVRRSKSDWPGTWAWPGGRAENGETPEACAHREALEELGENCGFDGLTHVETKRTDHGWDHTTFVARASEEFEPRLNDEHDGFEWCELESPPEPLHPGVRATIMTEDAASAIREIATALRGPGAMVSPPGYVVKDDAGRSTFPHGADESAGGKSSTGAPSLKSSSSYQITSSGAKSKTDLPSLKARSSYRVGAMDGRYSIRYSPTTRSFESFALDRASVRSYDADGRLHVERSNISKATVNPYLGREIPNYEELGLDPNRRYLLLRDPDEIKRAAPTFNNLPVLSRHVPVSADAHRPELVIGSTGTDASVRGPYLTNSLVLWSQPDIDDVESGKKRELSAAYRYRADMTPGVFDGQRYDGVMRDLRGNHVALVSEGRAGHDVVIGDAKPLAFRPLRFGLDKAWYEEHHQRQHGMFAPSVEPEEKDEARSEEDAGRGEPSGKSELSSNNSPSGESSTGQVGLKSYTISYGGKVLGRMSGNFDVRPVTQG